MEEKPSRGSEGAAAEVPDSEKPSVPLNSLKMMFERGENLTDKASPFLSSDGDQQEFVFNVLLSCVSRIKRFHEN